MSDDWRVRVSHVWKRYCGNLQRGSLYALGDALRTFCNVRPEPRSLRRHEFWSLRDVDFEVPAGQCLAVVGRNGAGKSTLLKLLTGVVPPDRGEVRVRGRLIALMMVGVGFHPMLSGRENVYIYGSFLGMTRAEIDRRFDDIIEFSELHEFIDTPVKYYSSGMYVRLSYSIAAQAEPDVLLVDEVLAVGDLAFREKCIRHLQELKGRGTTLLLVSHSTGQLRRLADQALWLEKGVPVAFGQAEGILEAYLAEAESVSAKEAKPTAAPSAISLAAAAPEPQPASDSTDVADSQPAAPQPLAAHEIAEVVEVRLDGTRLGAEDSLLLQAHRTSTLSLRLRFRERVPETVARVLLSDDRGEILCGAEFLPRSGAFPQADPSGDLQIDWRLTPRLVRQNCRLRAVVARTTPEGAEELMADLRWTAAVRGAASNGAGPIDLREEFTASRAADGAPEEIQLGDRLGARLADPGDALDVRARLKPGFVLLSLIWRLETGAGEVLRSVEIPLPHDLGPADALDVGGRFEAHLLPGNYRCLVEAAGSGGMPHRLLSEQLVVSRPAVTLGCAELGPRLHLRESDALSSTATPAPAVRRVRADGSVVPTLTLRRLRLVGTDEALSAMVYAAEHLRAERSFQSSATCPVAFAAAGERCRIELDVEKGGDLRELDLQFLVQQPKQPPVAGFCFRDLPLGAAPSRLTAVIDLAVNLSPAEYLLSLHGIATAADGTRLELNVADVVRVHVIGPPTTPNEALLGMDGRIEVAAAVMDGGWPAVPGAAGRSGADEDSPAEILEFVAGGSVWPRTALVAAGRPLSVSATLSSREDVGRVGFKMSLITPDKRRVASIDTSLLPHLLPSEGLNRSCVAYRMRPVPHLAPGAYDVHFALWGHRRAKPEIIARRFNASRWVIPARATQMGPWPMDAWVSLDWSAGDGGTEADAERRECA